MIIVYADSSLKDICALKPISFECAFGEDENTFELIMPMSASRLAAFNFVYADATELGGMITDIKNDYENNQIVYTGFTWQGLLEHKILEPDSGKDYLTITGEVNTCLRTLINRVGLSSVLSAPSESTGLAINNYQFNRYVDAYTGLRAMLNTIGLTLSIICTAGKVVVSSIPIKTLYERCNTETYAQPVNHLICLGKGDLAARTVIHLYADAKGNVSKTKTLTGIKERAEVYDYSNSEADELEAKGIEKLKEYQEFKSAEFLDLQNDNYSIDDYISSYDSATDITITNRITKKIVSVNRRGRITTEFKSGDKSTAKSY